jgi:hypothetical protein
VRKPFTIPTNPKGIFIKKPYLKAVKAVKTMPNLKSSAGKVGKKVNLQSSVNKVGRVVTQILIATSGVTKTYENIV